MFLEARSGRSDEARPSMWLGVAVAIFMLVAATAAIWEGLRRSDDIKTALPRATSYDLRTPLTTRT